MKSITSMMLALAAAFALAGAAQPLAAQTANPIALNGDVKAVKVITDPDGKERTELVDPTTIVPGDRLVFGTDYTNKGSEAVTNFIVTNPLPAAVRLAPDADPALEVSVDGGKTFGALAALAVTADDGTTRPATHADVTHVRWVLASIEPGGSGRLTYPAIIR
ncbi:hypothetical protein [Erythrobacter tepidarius]|uniref:hypothetical protein n=1 Tax=Erythrobacter tepidarius TaxID=60454 RepID=UPI001B80112F|nr:hypothetical protein [Erythrobacter tepidarius]